MTAVQEAQNVYLSNFAEFQKRLGDKAPAWLRRLHKTALERFVELGFPTARNEDWKFTSVAPLAKIPFRPAAEDGSAAVPGELLSRATFGQAGAIRLVFVNGRWKPELSALEQVPEGVRVEGLAQALAQRP